MSISTQLQQLLRVLLPDKGFKTAGSHRDAIIAGVEESKTYADEKAAEAVKKTGNETIGGVKTFTSAPVVPDATEAQHPVTLTQGVLKTQIKQTTGTSETDVMSQKAVTAQVEALNDGKVNTTDIEQARSQATNKVPSSKLFDDEITKIINLGAYTGIVFIPDPEIGFHSPKKARAAIPDMYRYEGVRIRYRVSENSYITETFKGTLADFDNSNATTGYTSSIKWDTDFNVDSVFANNADFTNNGGASSDITLALKNAFIKAETDMGNNIQFFLRQFWYDPLTQYLNYNIRAKENGVILFTSQNFIPVVDANEYRWYHIYRSGMGVLSIYVNPSLLIDYKNTALDESKIEFKAKKIKSPVSVFGVNVKCQNILNGKIYDVSHQAKSAIKNIVVYGLGDNDKLKISQFYSGDADIIRVIIKINDVIRFNGDISYSDSLKIGIKDIIISNDTVAFYSSFDAILKITVDFDALEFGWKYFDENGDTDEFKQVRYTLCDYPVKHLTDKDLLGTFVYPNDYIFVNGVKYRKFGYSKNAVSWVVDEAKLSNPRVSVEVKQVIPPDASGYQDWVYCCCEIDDVLYFTGGGNARGGKIYTSTDMGETLTEIVDIKTLFTNELGIDNNYGQSLYLNVTGDRELLFNVALRHTVDGSNHSYVFKSSNNRTEWQICKFDNGENFELSRYVELDGETIKTEILGFLKEWNFDYYAKYVVLGEYGFAKRGTVTSPVHSNQGHDICTRVYLSKDYGVTYKAYDYKTIASFPTSDYKYHTHGIFIDKYKKNNDEPRIVAIFGDVSTRIMITDNFGASWYDGIDLWNNGYRQPVNGLAQSDGYIFGGDNIEKQGIIRCERNSNNASLSFGLHYSYLTEAEKLKTKAGQVWANTIVYVGGVFYQKEGKYPALHVYFPETTTKYNAGARGRIIMSDDNYKSFQMIFEDKYGCMQGISNATICQLSNGAIIFNPSCTQTVKVDGVSGTYIFIIRLT